MPIVTPAGNNWCEKFSVMYQQIFGWLKGGLTPTRKSTQMQHGRSGAGH
jgi:hypothetical protein